MVFFWIELLKTVLLILSTLNSCNASPASTNEENGIHKPIYSQSRQDTFINLEESMKVIIYLLRSTPGAFHLSPSPRPGSERLPYHQEAVVPKHSSDIKHQNPTSLTQLCKPIVNSGYTPRDESNRSHTQLRVRTHDVASERDNSNFPLVECPNSTNARENYMRNYRSAKGYAFETDIAKILYVSENPNERRYVQLLRYKRELRG